jgi:DNA-binding NtrC family response regulator
MKSTSEESLATDLNAPPHSGNLRLRDIERAAIEHTLAQTGNNQSQAARILGISRPTLLRKLKGYRVEDAAAHMHRSAQAAADFDERCCPDIKARR